MILASWARPGAPGVFVNEEFDGIPLITMKL